MILRECGEASIFAPGSGTCRLLIGFIMQLFAAQIFWSTVFWIIAHGVKGGVLIRLLLWGCPLSTLIVLQFVSLLLPFCDDFGHVSLFLFYVFHCFLLFWLCFFPSFQFSLHVATGSFAHHNIIRNNAFCTFKHSSALVCHTCLTFISFVCLHCPHDKWNFRSWSYKR